MKIEEDNGVLLQPRGYGWGRGSFTFVVRQQFVLLFPLMLYMLYMMSSSPIVLRTDSQQALSHEAIISE